MRSLDNKTIGETGSKPYRDFAGYLRQRFGTRVQKIPVDAGFTCPNRDGSAGEGGCLYCAADGTASPLIDRTLSIEQQVKKGIAHFKKKYSDPRFIVYFQPHSNTYGPVDTLRECYRSGLEADELVVGLAISTRPDCLSEEVLEVIAEFLPKEIWVEIGLQSMHEKTMLLLNRGHNLATFEQAVMRAAARRFKICIHVILGLPGESHREMMETAVYLASLPIDGIKIHSLYALEGTGLATMVRQSTFRFLTAEEYIRFTCDFLEHLREDIVIQRLTGDSPKYGLIGPDWCRDKRRILAGIQAEFASRNTCQGSRYSKTTPVI